MADEIVFETAEKSALELIERDQHYDMYLRNISWPLGGAEYFRDLTEFPQHDILVDPGDGIDNYILKNTTIKLDKVLRENMIKSLENGLYEDFITLTMFDARSIVKARYSADTHPNWLDEPYGQDLISLSLLENLAKRTSIWKRTRDSKQLSRNLISLVLSGYFAINERGVYLSALSPNAGVDDLILALKNSGPGLPKLVQKKIRQLEPISELKRNLTRELMTWGDIWTVRLMGRIGNAEFVPDLIHVLRDSDSMDYIHSDAIKAMNALDDSADDIIISAILFVPI